MCYVSVTATHEGSCSIVNPRLPIATSLFGLWGPLQTIDQRNLMKPEVGRCTSYRSQRPDIRERREASMGRLRSRGQGGQGMVEYALILVLVSIVVIVILLTMGNQIQNVFSNVVAALGA